MNKQEILELLKERDELLEKRNDSNYNDKRVDDIQDEITNEIKNNFNDYEVDFIIETWTRFGAAPCVMYDDNGMFAITDDGYQPVVTGDEKIEGEITVFVEKEQWFKSIRDALGYYIFENN